MTDGCNVFRPKFLKPWERELHAMEATLRKYREEQDNAFADKMVNEIRAHAIDYLSKQLEKMDMLKHLAPERKLEFILQATEQALLAAARVLQVRPSREAL